MASLRLMGPYQFVKYLMCLYRQLQQSPKQEREEAASVHLEQRPRNPHLIIYSFHHIRFNLHCTNMPDPIFVIGKGTVDALPPFLHRSHLKMPIVGESYDISIQSLGGSWSRTLSKYVILTFFERLGNQLGVGGGQGDSE